MGLIEEFDAIAKQISQQQQWMTTEQATINVAIHPFIRVLGYDTNNLAEVRPEYTADAKSSGSERVDYAIMRDGAPIIFIEAKASNISLSESSWKQLYNYFNAEVGLRFGILTNGIEYRFYTDLQVRNIMDKQPFMTLDMLNLDKRLVSTLDNFAKASFDPQRIIDDAQRQVIRHLLQQEMDSPSSALVKHCASQVHSGRLYDSDIQRYARLLKEAWRELVDREVASRIDLLFESDQQQTETKPTSTLPDPPPLPTTNDVKVPIYGELKKGKYAGHRFEAILLLNETIYFKQKVVLFHGTTMTPSGAAKSGFNKAIGEHPDVNGWWFWKITDPESGKERPIDKVISDEDLRQRLIMKYKS